MILISPPILPNTSFEKSMRWEVQDRRRKKKIGHKCYSKMVLSHYIGKTAEAGKLKNKSKDWIFIFYFIWFDLFCQSTKFNFYQGRPIHSIKKVWSTSRAGFAGLDSVFLTQSVKNCIILPGAWKCLPWELNN